MPAADLPFFLGLMEHLAQRGINCPQPVKNKKGDVLGKIAGRPAAIVTFLDGMWIRRPEHQALRRGRRGAGAAASRRRDFQMQRANALSVDGWRPLYEQANATARDSVQPGLCKDDRRKSSIISSKNWPRGLPHGVIHADLFPDNVFFLGDRAVGPDRLLFRLQRHARLRRRDLPERLVLRAGPFLQRHQGPGAAVRATRKSRALSTAEREALPMLARGAALRFLLTRLVDWLAVPDGALVRPKDPLEYFRKLRFHQSLKSVRDYGTRA